MKPLLLPGFVLLIAGSLAGSARAQTPVPSEHPFFKAIQGTWIGEGSLMTRDQGEWKVREEWMAASEEGGGYRLSGSRRIGDETHEFSWLFLLNTTSGSYECEYEHAGMEQPMRFEVSISDTRVELRSPLGGPGSELLITNTLAGDLLEGAVKHVDAAGQEVTSGKVTHRRRE